MVVENNNDEKTMFAFNDERKNIQDKISCFARNLFTVSVVSLLMVVRLSVLGN